LVSCLDMETPSLRSLERTLIGLQLHHPGEGRLLSGMVRVASVEQATVGISAGDGRATIEMHPEFTSRYSEEDQIEFLRHELYHWLLGHPFQRPTYSNNSLFDVAADAIVNALLTRPTGGIHLPFLQEGKVYAIAEVVEQLESREEAPIEINNLFSAHRRWWREQTPDPIDQELEEVQWGRRVRSFLNALPAESAESNRVQQIKDFWAPYLTPHAPIRWKLELQRFARTTAAATTVEHTLHRPSKRYGTHPGIKIQRRHRLVVAFDISGSMSIEDWTPLLRELKRLWKTGSQLEVITFDTEVRQHFSFRGNWPSALSGGGGTNFNAPINWVRARSEADGLVLLTDGQAPAPVVPLQSPILWVISPKVNSMNASSFLQFPGKTIQLTEL
jgi:predicted metal-dependent peptidase